MPDWKDLIETAMKDRAPELHRSLVESGDLGADLRDRVMDAKDRFVGALQGLDRSDPLPESGLERLQKANQHGREATEIVIAQVTEFESDPPPTV